MSIEKNISELLFEHDCVIIPGFGGLVCNYSPAYIHAGKNQFHPPFKKISFNRNLKNNDGLLANQISKSEEINYSEANRLISKCISEFSKELNSNKHFDLKNIGSFYLGTENTILFEQDVAVNYLPESFGLSAFYSSAIKREPIVRKLERKLKDNIIVPLKEQKKTSIRKRIPAARYLAVAASLLILASLVFISLKTDLLKNTSFANLNPFAEASITLYKPSENNLPDADADLTKENIRNPIASNGGIDTMRYLHIMINGNIPTGVRLGEDEAPVIKTKSLKQTSSGHFHIIGGAFAVPENADKFVSKLKNLGYDATILEKKLRFVSYGGFSSRETAQQALDKIRLLQPEAWLLKI